MKRGRPQQGVTAELLVIADATSFYVRGWSSPANDALAAVGPGARRIELHDAYRYARADLAKRDEGSGFACFVETARYLGAPGAWSIEAGPAAISATADAIVAEPGTARDAILTELSLEPPDSRELVARHLHPAIERVQSVLAHGVGVASVEDHGRQPDDPEVSVVVPLYGRVDLLASQVESLAVDPELREVELLYVLDSPELLEEASAAAAKAAAASGRAVRLAAMSRNAGFAAACNAGAELARGGLLLLLNSDVTAPRAGWLGRLVEALREARAGAVGPTLLYPDGSVQHAGMYFERERETGLWANRHYAKGEPATALADAASRPVPALTAACLLLERDVFLELGGFDRGYVRGDFEDSDLCLRLRERGLESWYVADAVLVHGEAQSYPIELRRLAWRYNAWRHTERWNDAIEAVMDAVETAPAR